MPSAFIGLLAGAAAAYMYDPVQGRRRRALLRDKAVSAKRQARDFADAASRDFRSGAVGASAFLQHDWSPAARVVSGGAASALIAYGLARGGLFGLLGFLGGAVMLSRTIANRPLAELAKALPAKAQSDVASQQKQPWAGA